MEDFLFKYIVAIIIALLLFILLNIIRIGVKAYFDVQMKKAHATSGVATTGILVLSTAFLALIGLSNALVGLLVSFIQKLFPNLKIIPPTDTFSMIAFAIFAITVSFICYTFYRKHETYINELEYNQFERNIDPKIDSPPTIPTQSPIFYERIKELLQLKYKKFNIEWQVTKNEPRNKILYGHYTDFHRTYFKLVFCWDDYAKLITIENQNQIYHTLFELGKSLNPNNHEIHYDFYCITNGNYDKIAEIKNDKTPLYIRTENEFVNELIDFNPYLKQLLKKFQEDKLPITNITKDEDKFTLAKTYIEPNFNNGNNELKIYLDNWLLEDSDKHIALLGDYGTGKTSFMKYYAFHLADKLLQGETVVRYPFFISLTNTSPMHGGIEKSIKAALSENDLDTNYETLQKLIHRGKVVFLLDGFDEMGFIGTHENRFEQLNAIWKLATKGNKIIISGRPSYFPSEFEEKSYLNIKSKDEQNIPQSYPYCERIELDFFEEEQIKASIRAYYPNQYEVEKYWEFICSNESIYELCCRPSMMHIVREMLPLLTQDESKKELKGGELMRLYIDNWIDRQYSKSIVSAFKDTISKREFLFAFFRDLAGDNYDVSSGNVSLHAYEVKELLWKKLVALKLIGDEQIQGFESEILTGYFLERTGDEYKFVHKSFLEYFIAQYMIDKLQIKSESQKILNTRYSAEAINFVYESYSKEEIEKIEHIGVPLLAKLIYGNNYGYLLSKFYFLFAIVENKISLLCFRIINLILKRINLNYVSSKGISKKLITQLGLFMALIFALIVDANIIYFNLNANIIFILCIIISPFSILSGLFLNTTFRVDRPYKTSNYDFFRTIFHTLMLGVIVIIPILVVSLPIFDKKEHINFFWLPVYVISILSFTLAVAYEKSTIFENISNAYFASVSQKYNKSESIFFSLIFLASNKNMTFWTNKYAEEPSQVSDPNDQVPNSAVVRVKVIAKVPL